MRLGSRRLPGAKNPAKVVLASALLLGVAVLPSSAAKEIPGQPGLPDFRETTSDLGYIRPQTRGVNYVAKAKQWVATPNIMTASYSRGSTRQTDLTCTRIRKVPGAKTLATFRANTVLANADAAPGSVDRFGQSQAFEVRTVAFGSIPVTVTLALEQPRDADGTVESIYIEVFVAEWCAHNDPFPTRPPNPDVGEQNSYNFAEGSGQARVRIDRLVVDGVPVDLSGGCRSDWGNMTIGSPGYHTFDPAFGAGDLAYAQNRDTSRFFGIVGGLATGAIDVGPFAGCATTGGDDLSGLLTAAVSGEGNRLEMRTQGIDKGPDDDGLIGCPYDSNCVPFWPRPQIPEQAPAGS